MKKINRSFGAGQASYLAGRGPSPPWQRSKAAVTLRTVASSSSVSQESAEDHRFLPNLRDFFSVRKFLRNLCCVRWKLIIHVFVLFWKLPVVDVGTRPRSSTRLLTQHHSSIFWTRLGLVCSRQELKISSEGQTWRECETSLVEYRCLQVTYEWVKKSPAVKGWLSRLT